MGVLEVGFASYPDMPVGVYCRGMPVRELFDKTAAVVGSRRVTSYGRVAVEKLVSELVGEGYTIVSGFMYGVDMLAHETALKYGGKTVAVLGWGIDYKMNYVQEKMAQKIIQGAGLVLSSWLDLVPTRWSFPVRNKLVAGISQRIYVVEAAIGSGSLITTRYGEKMGREIWAVPGPVTSKMSAGTNELIRMGRAKVWLPQPDGPNKSYTKNTIVYTLLQSEAMTVDELSRQLNMGAAEVGVELMLLELDKKIKRVGNRYFVT